jgi:two-component system OmpR family response regulator
LRILLLEDDNILGNLIKEHLSKENSVVWVQTIQNATELCQKTKFDMMLFDANLPDGNGFELLKELRFYNDKTPAIFITSAGSAQDVKKGFEIGCDDYLKKPFDFDELDARVEHLKKIYQIEQSDTVKLDADTLYFPASMQININNETTKLRPMEAKVLSYFLANQNRFISYEELFRALWSFDDTPNEATVRSYIKTLRKVLKKDFIQSQRGVGYRFERI